MRGRMQKQPRTLLDDLLHLRPRRRAGFLARAAERAAPASSASKRAASTPREPRRPLE